MVSLRTLFGDDADILRDRDLQVLLLAGLTGPLGAALLSPLLDSLTGPFGVSSARIGLLMSAQTAPMIFLIPVMGVLSDRIGRKPVLVGGLLLFGFSGAAITLTTDFRVALALRLLQGIGAAGILPVIVTSLGDIYAGTAETTAQGFRFMSSGVTQTVFPAIAGFLVVFGWRYPILIYGIAVLIAGVVLVALEEPRQHGAGGSEDASDGTAADAPEATPDGGAQTVLQTLGHRRVRWLLVVYGIPATLYVGFLTYVSILVVRLLDGTAGQAGLLVAITNVMKAVAASQAGRIAAAFDRQTYPLVGANLVLGGGLATIAIAPSVVVAAVGVLLLGSASGLLLSVYRSLLTGLASERTRGGVVSAGESILRVGMTLAPIVAGGAIAVTSPLVGFGAAVRWTLLGLAVVGVGISIVGLLLARPLRIDAPVS